jgi:hypothetical protein
MVAERKIIVDCPACDGHGQISWQDPIDEVRYAGGKVLVEVAVRRGVTVGDMVGPSRTLKINHARQEAMWMMRCDNISLKNIGWLLGHRDHSTIHHGIEQHCLRTGAPMPVRAERG